MSEVPPHNPNEDILQDFRQARKFAPAQAIKLDAAGAASLYQQMADRFQAEGDDERAKRYRELAKMTIEEDRKAKNSPSDKEIPQREDQKIKKTHEQAQPETGRRLSTSPPRDWRTEAIRLNTVDTKALVSALKAKANQPLQRQVKPPETK